MVDIRIDTSRLSHTRFLIPEHDSGFIDGADVPSLRVAPGEYSFQMASGLLASFHFTVSSDGLLDYPDTCDAFLEGRGARTLTVRGFAITLDGTSLSHDILPTISGADVLTRDQTHELTLLPAVGYGFQPAAGLVGDFRFNVSVDGSVVVDSRYSGFAHAEGRTLTIGGYKLTVDGRKLSHGLLPMNLLGGAVVLTRDQTHELTLLPAVGYGFQPAAGLVGDFRFNVSVDGSVVVDSRYSGFAHAEGRTLTIGGYKLTVDGRKLSHGLLPMNLLGGAVVLTRDQTHELTLLPAVGYGFQPAAGLVGDFRFNVSVDGSVVVDSRYSGFAHAEGRTLTIGGYKLTVDGRKLSHGLLPMNLLGGAVVLTRDQTHELTLLPAVGYGFQPAAGLVGDFRFNVSVDGSVVVDSRYSGFAHAEGRTLTIGGYKLTVDGRKLSHGLLPMNLLGGAVVLTRDQTHELTLLPAVGYGFQPAAGLVGDFRFNVSVDGSVVVDSRYSGFAQAEGRTLTIGGYKVSLDTSELSESVTPSLLNYTSGPLPPGVSTIVVLPASSYRIFRQGNSIPVVQFSLDVAGITTLIDAPDGVTVISERTFCGVPDRIVTDLQIQTYGPPKGRWSRRILTYSFDPANAKGVTETQVSNAIVNAFFQWQAAGGLFSFDPVAGNGDIRLAFGGREVYSRFGSPGGVLATAKTPEFGIVLFDSSESWTEDKLRHVALHEIGHALGLRHSDSPSSLMFAAETGAQGIDEESRDALRRLYGWRDPTRLEDRATSDRPALAAAGRVTLSSSTVALHMVWKGIDGDPGLYESTFTDGAWSAQSRIHGQFGSTHSPGLASYSITSDGISTGLILACRGVEGDPGLYVAHNEGMGWPSSPTKIPDVGSSSRPAVAALGPTPYVAWKGVVGDSGIYWTRRTEMGWQPQQRVQDVGTSHSPALVVFRDKLHMFWKGIEEDERMYFSKFVKNTSSWEPQQEVLYTLVNADGPTTFHVGTSRGPSATVDGNRIMVAWKGMGFDPGIYFSMYDGTTFTGQIHFNAATNQGPGICSFNGITHMVFRGAEEVDSMWWSTL